MTQESNAFDGGVGESLGAVFADNLIRLRSVVYHDQLYRVLSIQKMRQSGFDPGLREFRIEEGAIRVLPVAESGIGVLSGIAAQERHELPPLHDDGGA
jgi:KaiC/GvpD/RAD55 family RecA-like ATPase